MHRARPKTIARILNNEDKWRVHQFLAQSPAIICAKIVCIECRRLYSFSAGHCCSGGWTECNIIQLFVMPAHNWFIFHVSRYFQQSLPDCLTLCSKQVDSCCQQRILYTTKICASLTATNYQKPTIHKSFQLPGSTRYTCVYVCVYVSEVQQKHSSNAQFFFLSLHCLKNQNAFPRLN